MSYFSINLINMKITILAFFLFLAFHSYSQDCNSLPTTFTSYKEAMSKIKTATFTLIDRVNTSKSSWVRGASYYSCDKKTGYFIILTDKEEYIHEGVPINIWRGFKSANSFGTFYNENIRNRFRLIPF